MLDLKLRVLLRHLATIDALDQHALRLEEALGHLIGERAHRDDRKARIELHRRYRVAGAGTNESLLEMRVRDRFIGADEPRAELHPRGSHLEIGQHRLAAPDAAGDEDWDLGNVRQYLLDEDTGRHRTDMAARLHALDDDGVGAHPNQLPGDHERRREAHKLDAGGIDAPNRGGARQGAGEDDMAHLARRADIDQLHQLPSDGG